MKKLTLTTLFLLILTLPITLLAQVKTFKEVVGHKIGERITLSHQILLYLNYLEEASDRVVLQEIGTTFDHKLQVAAIITSPENHTRIAEIRRNAQRLNDPRTTYGFPGSPVGKTL